MTIPTIPVVVPIDPTQREMWDREVIRSAAEVRRKARMLCRRGHVWADVGPVFTCGDGGCDVETWRECSRCGMSLRDRPGRGPHRKPVR